MADQSQETGEKKQIPIVPYLRLPTSATDEAYLVGNKCGNCGETYLGSRAICLNCGTSDQMEEIKLSRTGELFTYTVVHQSVPWIRVPYVAAVVRLPEGPFVRASLVEVDPTPEDGVKTGTRVEMLTEKVRQDKEGNDIIAYKFRPL